MEIVKEQEGSQYYSLMTIVQCMNPIIAIADIKLSWSWKDSLIGICNMDGLCEGYLFGGLLDRFFAVNFGPHWSSYH